MASPFLIAVTVASALAIGLLHALLETVRPALQERHGLDPEQGRRLSRLFAIFSVPLLVFTGWLGDQVGHAAMIFAGSLVLGVGVALLTQARQSLPWAVFAMAAGGSAITTAGLALMAVTLIPHRAAGASLNVGFIFIGLAALATPAALPWFFTRIGFRKTLVIVALLCLAPALCVLLVPDKTEFVPPKTLMPIELIFNDARFWLIVFPVFLYFPLDRSLDVWTKPFLTEFGYRGSAITRLFVGFWVAFLLMRLAFGWIFIPGYEVWLLLLLLVISSMILGNLMGAYASSSGYFGLWLVGACYGPLLPGFLGVLVDFDRNYSVPTVVLGGVFALGFLSDLLIEPRFVAYASTRTARASMRIPMVLALIMAAPILMLAVIRYAQ